MCLSLSMCLSACLQAVTVNAALKGALAAKKKRRSCDVMVTNLLCSLLALALLAVLVVLLVTS